MNKDIMQMANMAMTIANGCNRTIAGQMVRLFLDKYATDEDLVDIFAALVDKTDNVFHVVIDGINPAIRLNKILAIKAVRATKDCGLRDAKNLVDIGDKVRVEVFTGGPRDAFHLRDQLRENGYFAEVF